MHVKISIRNRVRELITSGLAKPAVWLLGKNRLPDDFDPYIEKSSYA